MQCIWVNILYAFVVVLVVVALQHLEDKLLFFTCVTNKKCPGKLLTSPDSQISYYFKELTAHCKKKFYLTSSPTHGTSQWRSDSKERSIEIKGFQTHLSFLVINKQIPGAFPMHVGYLQTVIVTNLLWLKNCIQVLHGDDNFG